MNRAALRKIPLRTNRFAGLAPILHRILFVLFLIQFALVWSGLWLHSPLLGQARWPEGLLVVLATATTVFLAMMTTASLPSNVAACGVEYDMELPETSYQTRECPLTAEQNKAYKALHDRARYLYRQHQFTAANAGVLMQKLLQVASGWAYATTGQTILFDNTSRLDALLEVLEETDGKVLVFVQHVSAVAELHKLLLAKGYDVEPITGASSLTERDRIFTRVQQDPALKAIVAHPGCMSHGLTLTGANVIVWWTPTVSRETYEQANGRITRPGQLSKTLVLHLCGSQIERKVYALLEKKGNVQAALLSMFVDVEINEA